MGSIIWFILWDCVLIFKGLDCKQDEAGAALRKHLAEGAHDLNGEAFTRFMDQFYDRISAMLNNADVTENLGALRAIDELIDVPLGESASKVSRISNYMQAVFEKKRDPDVLVLGSRVLGHLALSAGALAAEEVENQVFCVNITLQWILVGSCLM